MINFNQLHFNFSNFRHSTVFYVNTIIRRISNHLIPVDKSMFRTIFFCDVNFQNKEEVMEQIRAFISSLDADTVYFGLFIF